MISHEQIYVVRGGDVDFFSNLLLRTNFHHKIFKIRPFYRINISFSQERLYWRLCKYLPQPNQILEYRRIITPRVLSKNFRYFKFSCLYRTFKIRRYMGSGQKYGLIRTILNSARPWIKTCQCTKFIWTDIPMDRQTQFDSENDSNSENHNESIGIIKHRCILNPLRTTYVRTN